MLEDQTENLENISNHFDEMAPNQFYMKEQITDFSNIEKFKINFTYCHIAISKNGGLIAICKKKGFLDMQKGAMLNKNVLVMFQDAVYRYYIPIRWDYDKRYVVCLDFSPKDNLYGILNDGGIMKFIYNERKHKEIVSPRSLREEGIVKAKFFDKGFIAFTQFENFYYIKDIKNPIAILMCSFTSLMKFSPDVDFALVPPEYSSSKKLELLITREEDKGGIIQIIQKEEGQNIQMNIVNQDYFEIIGASLILKEKPQKLYIQSKYVGAIDNNNKKKGKKSKKDKKKKAKKENEENPIPPPPKPEDEGVQDEIGEIDAIAISPTGEKIAFYNSSKKTAFIMDSDFSGKYKEVKFEYDETSYSDLENKEITDLREYNEGCQFLFCGEETLALSRQRFILLSKPGLEQSLVYFIHEGGESEVKHGALFSKCITEVDGLRLLTNDGVFLITKVPKELVDICHPFSHSPSKKLVQIYRNTLFRKYNADKDIRSLSSVLADSIEKMQLACANIFWIENNDEEFKKEAQFFLLKAAQYAKKFVNKEEFNFDKYNRICRDMRIVNNLRNDEKFPIFITYGEYKEMDPKEIIGRLLKYNNFQLAADISKFLEYGLKKVLHKYVIAIMKKEIDNIEITIGKPGKVKEIDEGSNSVENNYGLLFYHLEKVPGISYIKLAKKASKYGGERLAMYLLEQEKSALIKIPQLLQLSEKYEEAIMLAFETYNFNGVIKVLHKIIKEGNIKVLSSPNLQKYYPKILLYLKKYEPDCVKNYLKLIKNNAGVFYMQLNDFFNKATFDDRTAVLKDLKAEYKKIDNDPNFDSKFIKKYLEKQENSLTFKKNCMNEDKAIIHYSEIEPYSISINDCYKNGVMKGKANWIEAQNKHFDYSHKKVNLIKLRTYLEMRRPDAVDSQLEKTSLKKMGLSPMNLGEMYFDNKYYDKATEYLMQVKEPFYSSYVIDLLKNMEKYKEALEFIISNKSVEDKEILIEEILNKQPRLDKYVEEFCTKYKVNLQK